MNGGTLTGNTITGNLRWAGVSLIDAQGWTVSGNTVDQPYSSDVQPYHQECSDGRMPSKHGSAALLLCQVSTSTGTTGNVISGNTLTGHYGILVEGAALRTKLQQLHRQRGPRADADPVDRLRRPQQEQEDAERLEREHLQRRRRQRPDAVLIRARSPCARRRPLCDVAVARRPMSVARPEPQIPASERFAQDIKELRLAVGLETREDTSHH